jgi:mRNA-degrading endonuclease toxin of MazEF toxin-antitoxin module
VKCENLLTIAQGDIRRTIGHLSSALKQKLDAALKSALELC